VLDADRRLVAACLSGLVAVVIAAVGITYPTLADALLTRWRRCSRG
jgi:Flp pilus assembly pilin Flp